MRFKPRTARITITRAQLDSWYPCYEPEDIDEISDGRDSMTLLKVMQLNIPAADRIWVASSALSTKDARLFAVWCAEQVLTSDCDPRSRAAVDTARRYAYGEATANELAAAREAAREAVVCVAWYWYAAHAAESAHRTSWDTTVSAARGAASRAARTARNAVSRAAQVDRIIAHLTGEEPLT